MQKKPLRKAAKPGTAKASAVAFARARDLIARGRFAAARRLLLAIARVKGPYQARARVLLARLAKGAIKPPRKKNGGTMRSPATSWAQKMSKKGGHVGGPASFKIGEAYFTGRISRTHFIGGRGSPKIGGSGGSSGRPERLPPRPRRRAPARRTPKRTARTKPPKKLGMIRRTPHIDLPRGTRSPGDSSHGEGVR